MFNYRLNIIPVVASSVLCNSINTDISSLFYKHKLGPRSVPIDTIHICR
jgi:hypothetical protein